MLHRSALRVSDLRPLTLLAAVLGLVAALVVGLTVGTSALVETAVASDASTDPSLPRSSTLADATEKSALAALAGPSAREQLAEHAEQARKDEKARKAAAEKAAAEKAARKAEEERKAAAERAARSQARRAVADPKAAARSLLGDYGWGADQFSCLDSLWTKESGWKHTADNPTSSAYGIPQALPGSKMASAGSDWETNPVTQITWGLGYIADVYGSPCAAWSHSQAVNWY